MAHPVDNEMSISGYTLDRKDRNDVDTQRGGRVAVYVHNDLSCVHREEIFELNFPETIETLRARTRYVPLSVRRLIGFLHVTPQFGAILTVMAAIH